MTRPPGPFTMPSCQTSNKRKLQLLATFTTLFLFAVGVGCKGFFVNPTLTSVAVSPSTANITQGSNQQMTATGTFNDNTTKTLTGSNVSWSSSDSSKASVSNSGLVTGAAQGTATITATSLNLSGTATVNVTLANVTGITISPTTITQGPNTTVDYHAFATVSGSSTTVDVTASVQWSASDSTNISIPDGTNPAVATIGANTPAETVTITARYTSNTTIFTQTATLNVN